MTRLEFEGVSFSYGDTPVICGVDFRLASGEVVALLGRNGAGKTTVTRLALALVHPRRGDVRIDGRSTRGRNPEDVADRAAYLFQHPDRQLFARRAVDEVMFGPLQLRRSRNEAHERALSALDAVGLGDHVETHPHDLSPSEQRLLALAAAVAQTDGLLVLDEPTQGLDRPTNRRVGALLREHAGQGGAALMVTHDLGFVADWCDRCLVLEDGRVTFDGMAGELVRDDRRARGMGLLIPPAARLSLALGLPGTPVRHDAVASSLAPRCRRS